MTKIDRIEKKFLDLKTINKKALITFVTAGDPDYSTSLNLIKKLPEAGADIIEIGMPFTDPMADGPGIQASYLRAIEAGQNLIKTIELVKEFRNKNNDTPIVLMGYYNPIYCYGVDKFLKDISMIGVDGLIIVDLPPEVDNELCIPAKKHGINFIRLATPTSDEKRLKKILVNSSGFLYYVSVAGITGSKTPQLEDIKKKIDFIKSKCSIPLAVGFGIRTPDQVKNIANISDGVVVGSAIIDRIFEGIESSKGEDFIVENALNLVKDLSAALRNEV
tara:strand:+ start:2618 stop:3445 length:828 start_codon:yes stop_codon:yes gene_type:complete